MRMSSKTKDSKYLSIILVPHSTNKIKTIKISSIRYKLFALSAIILTTVICFGLYFGNLVRDNNRLKIEIAQVHSTTQEQAKLLEEKTEMLSAMIEKQEEYAKTISEFSDKYKQMTENYVDENMESITASRGSSSRSFINDVSELKGILQNLQELNNSDGSIVSELSETEAKLQTYIDTIPTLWPTSGRISSYFGTRSDPFNSSAKKHEGLDIAASTGTSIKAAASGTVTFSDTNGNYGKCVIISHGNGISTLYGHASTLLVKVGQKVKKGDVIAKVGSTGRSTGPHLHFEVRVNGTQVNPLDYLDKK
ncbi:MAG: Murein DD-endopeptidase MepM [Firmicutes bacterium ADurb.Bin419]|nr:MAG: Murein DD-endopeptidase MepM [Firmicutes bacterium ADurb.Bin419]